MDNTRHSKAPKHDVTRARERVGSRPTEVDDALSLILGTTSPNSAATGPTTTGSPATSPTAPKAAAQNLSPAKKSDDGSELDDALSLILGTASPNSAATGLFTASPATQGPGSSSTSGERAFWNGETTSPPFAQTAPGQESPRKKPLWPLVVASLIVFFVVTSGLTFFLRFSLSEQAAMIAAEEAEGKRYLNESIALIQESDTIVISFDNAIERQVTESSLPQLETLLGQVPAAQDTLDSAIKKAELAQGSYTTEENQLLAQHAIDAATARKTLLNLSKQLTTYDIAAMRCAVEFNAAWDLIIAADGDMRLAVEVASKGGSGAVDEAVSYNRTAADKLTQANDALTRAHELLPEADFSAIFNYLAIRQESVELAIASDEALLNNDITSANSLNSDFVAKDGEAVELAMLIPEEPMSLIVAAYDTATGTLRTDYRTARDQAADADAFLRAFVGIDIKAG